MPKKRHKPEEIVAKLRQVDVSRESQAHAVETENARLRDAISNLTLDELISPECPEGMLPDDASSLDAT